MQEIVDWIEKGGFLIYPLFLLLIWGIYIIIVKSANLRQNAIIRPAVVERIEQLLLEKKIPEATAYCKQNPIPMTRVLLAGIINYEKSKGELKEILEEAGRQELPVIRKHITALGTIASLSPLLGLLGTVVGMISVFTILSQGENINASMLAGGISEALITTAGGLLIAMPTLAFYNYFNNRVRILIIEMERISLHMTAVLKRS